MKKVKGLEIIKERVSDFEKNKALIMKRGYGETNIRSNYIDIMFKALGWNIRNKYEVDREFSQKDKSKEANTKKVDYAFKSNGNLKFFIEAKEASVNLENNKDAIYQAKRYAYSSNGKAPIVILTDFEEFRVFNVLTAPLYDNPDKQLLKSHSFQYTDYVEKWDLIWETFSKEAVERGSLDELRGIITKNTKTMDKDFLEQITKWREVFAKNIAIRNEDLSVDDINEAVQRILDRLIFIRNLEDREIEPENTLLNIAKNKTNILKSLVPLFNKLNITYNGLLFKPHFSEKIIIDDKILYDVIREMCYPVSPFQFDVIEPEILGRIYEKFLGSKIRLTDSHRAKVEEKLEVRKAGGIYYTPEYIVDYIVKKTVGKKIAGLTPDEIKKIKIIDPACGSGSFLIGAYNYLLEYHRQWYIKNKSNKDCRSDWYKTKENEIIVNLHKRGNILQNNIFGVDIDKEATEVAIMSLYLKMLDDGFDKGERDLFFIKGAVLPNMTGNIKCGNSLISDDFFDDMFQIDTNLLREIKPFNWNTEFSDVMSKNKFDIVLGNPPYFSLETSNSATKTYLKKVSKVYAGKADILYFFFEVGLSLLNKNGLLSFITSRYFLEATYAASLREYIIKKSNVIELYDFIDFPVFEGVGIHTIISTLQKSDNDKPTRTEVINFIPGSKELTKDLNKHFSINITDNNWVLADSTDLKIFNKIREKCLFLSSIATIEQGQKTGKNSVYGISLDLAKTLEQEPLKKLIKNSHINKYAVNYKDIYLIYADEEFKINAYPKIKEYLNLHKSSLKNRAEACDNKYPWYRLQRPRRKDLFDAKEKIVVPYRAEYNKFAYDNQQFYNDGGDIRIIVLNENCIYDIKYILGILNSKLMNFYYQFIGRKKGKQYEYFVEPLSKIPIKEIDFNQTKQKQLYEAIINFSSELILSYSQLYKIKNESDKDLLSRKINTFEKNINNCIYKLYCLSSEDIRIIENKIACAHPCASAK